MKRREQRMMRKKGLLVEMLSEGATVSAACTSVCLGTSTFYRWLAEDEDFEDEVIGVRMALLIRTLRELRLQAYGQLVDEEQLVEMDAGWKKVKRKRFVNGRTSALKLLLEQMKEPLCADDLAVLEADDEEGSEGGEVSQDSLTLGAEDEKVGEEEGGDVSQDSLILGAEEGLTGGSEDERMGGEKSGEVSHNSLNLGESAGAGGDGLVACASIASEVSEVAEALGEMTEVELSELDRRVFAELRAAGYSAEMIREAQAKLGW